MTREQAIEILHKNMQNVNLRRHCYAVEAVMKALAARLGEEDNKQDWGIAGLLHDADWEITQKETSKHTHLVTNWIKEIGPNQEVHDAILAHGWGYVDGNPKPKNKMQWALYCCDELTGLIVATALVKEKNLSLVTVESIMKKWNQSGFAAGVNRDQIKNCETELNIPLKEFIEIAISAMQSISSELGL